MISFLFPQSLLPKDEGITLNGEVAHQQPSLPSLGVGYKHTTYGTTLPKIPVATTIQTTTFPNLINLVTCHFTCVFVQINKVSRYKNTDSK